MMTMNMDRKIPLLIASDLDILARTSAAQLSCSGAGLKNEKLGIDWTGEAISKLKESPPGQNKNSPFDEQIMWHISKYNHEKIEGLQYHKW